MTVSSNDELQVWSNKKSYGCFDAAKYAEALRLGDVQNCAIPAEVLNEASLSMDDHDFLKLALKAFVWGYAPMTVYRLKRAKTSKTPVNSFFRAVVIPKWQEPSPVSAPNVDVLYSSAFLDLSMGPQIFIVPQVPFYYVVQLDDAYGNSQASIGLRTSPGTDAKSFLIVGPNDPGYLDSQAHVKDGYMPDQILPVDTDHAWLIVRLPVNPYAVPGSPANLKASNAYIYSTKFTLAPFDGTNACPPRTEPAPEEFESPPKDGLTFFTWLGNAVRNNPPPRKPAFSDTVLPPYLMSPSPSCGQTEVFASFSPLGLDATGFNLEQLNERQRILLQVAGDLGNLLLKAGQMFAVRGSEKQHYWQMVTTSNIGKYPNTLSGWFVRSMAAFQGGIASLAPDGTYPLTGHDRDGNTLKGGNRYKLHFEPDHLPPLNEKGFWSVTIYTYESASGSNANLPCVAAAAVKNTAYSQVPNKPVSVRDTTHFSNEFADFNDNDTLFFAQAPNGLLPETPYYVINATSESFQLSDTWHPSSDKKQMRAVEVEEVDQGRNFLAGEVIPVHSLGSQQLYGTTLRGANLELNKDGSLTIFLQPNPPEERAKRNKHIRRNNWLPTPTDEKVKYQVMMRLYNPLPATPQSNRLSILSDTTIPLTTTDPAHAARFPQEPVTLKNSHGTYVVPGLEPNDRIE